MKSVRILSAPFMRRLLIREKEKNHGGGFMKLRKIIGLLTLTVLIGGSALAVEGCFEAGPGYGYGDSAPYYPYYSGAPVGYGDWDEHHTWHDRDWWVGNHRPWVEEHHHEWLTVRPAPHEFYGHHEGHEHD
jgi:hypothetical protein